MYVPHINPYYDEILKDYDDEIDMCEKLEVNLKDIYDNDEEDFYDEH